MNIEKQIQADINQYDIVVYMKGTPDFPQCGFSGKVIHLLKQCGVDFNQASASRVKCIDVLEDPEIRQGIKDFSHWPTIPQVYIKGEFIGGSDIVGEMYQQGELQKLLEASVESVEIE